MHFKAKASIQRLKLVKKNYYNSTNSKDTKMLWGKIVLKLLKI